MDMAVLGRDEAGYQAYTLQIREEYKHVPADLFRVGRSKVLNAFLQFEAIYHSSSFRARFESVARDNLKRELQVLNGE